MRDDPRIRAVAETIARQHWVKRVEDEESKTALETYAPEFDDLGPHREYLIQEEWMTARRAIRALEKYDADPTTEPPQAVRGGRGEGCA